MNPGHSRKNCVSFFSSVWRAFFWPLPAYPWHCSGIMPNEYDPNSLPAATGRKRSGPKKVTARYLENAALYHLERYATSRAHLGRLLMMRVERSARAHGTDRNEGAEWIAAVLDKLTRNGLLDDRAYAETRARSLHRRGTSGRGIRADLNAKGVAQDLIGKALAGLVDDVTNPEAAAAIIYARKRRLGPYRAPEQRIEKRERDMSALGRKGFSYDLVRQVIDAVDVTALEDILHHSRES
jgi:regulatory protein